MMMKLLGKLNRNITISIIVSMMLGLVMGYYLDLSSLKMVMPYLLFLMIYPMMINLKVEEILRLDKGHLKSLAITFVLSFILSPLIAFGIGKLFLGSYPDLFSALMLISAIPAGGMAAAWVGIAKGNVKSAVMLVVGNLLLSIFAVPLILKLVLNNVVSIDLMLIFRQIFLIVIVPLVAGDITIGVISMVLIAIGIKSKAIVANPSIILVSLLPLILYYIVIFSSSIFVSRNMGKEQSPVVFIVSMRNLTIAMALAASYFNPLSVVFVAIAFALQVPSGSFLAHKMGKKQ